MDDLRSGVRIGRSRGLFLRVCTANPFYAISAVLVFVGLRMSFNTQAANFPSWALLGGLAGYTLLLAGMAYLLVRFGNVWDDVRTLLLLVVLMFLVISVAFDEILSQDPRQGVACCLGGLIFAAALSEGLFRGLRLGLPFWFRLPYHLFLGLFFLYPAAISPLLRSPTDPALLWALYGFSPVAGLLTLTLIPAVRRGPAYVRANGSPWTWPLYPWVLFGVLGFGVCARSYYLCLSAQYSSAPGSNYDSLLSSIFGPYFLVPFLLGVIVLMLETGLVTRNKTLTNLALLAPAGLVALALVGHQHDFVYRKFLGLFEAKLGGSPAFLTLLAAGAFYAINAARRIPHAFDGLTATLFVLGVVGPDTLTFDLPDALFPAPIAIAAALQLALAIRRHASVRAVVASAGFAVALTWWVAAGWPAMPRTILVYHLAIFGAMLLGAVFRDAVGDVLRFAGAILILGASQVAIFCDLRGLGHLPPEAIRAYPLVLGVVAGAYGWFLHSRTYLTVAAASLLGGVAVFAWQGYGVLRRFVIGLDQIAWGLLSFLVAAVISLWKAGALHAWWEQRRLLMRAVAKPCPPEGLGEPL
jgi:hypothetical protein